MAGDFANAWTKVKVKIIAERQASANALASAQAAAVPAMPDLNDDDRAAYAEMIAFAESQG